MIRKFDLEDAKALVANKVFAVCDYYLQGKAHRNARHLYDIYKLTERVKC